MQRASRASGALGLVGPALMVVLTAVVAGLAACDVRDDGSVGLQQGDEPRRGAVGGGGDVTDAGSFTDAAADPDGVTQVPDTMSETGATDVQDAEAVENSDIGAATDTSTVVPDTTVAPSDAGPGPAADTEPEPPAPVCGDGVINQRSEVCDGQDLGGATCAALVPDRPEGEPTCTAACVLSLSACSAPDADGDLVPDNRDPFPNDFRRCGDIDNDGCDDCSVRGLSDPTNDGFDSNGDGRCELPLDWYCMNGANAATDPYRLEACVVFSHTNRDRAHFAEEAGNAGPVVWNEDLWVVARAHSLDMCLRGFFAHTNPDGRTPEDRARAAGIAFAPAENIAANLDPGAAQYGWMHRPTCRGHRGAILDSRATEAAIGYIKCADFASPAAYAWREHHLVTGLFRVAWGQQKSAFCRNPVTECEIPPDPPTTAPCPAQLRQWGFCPTPSAATLQGWNCPVD